MAAGVVCAHTILIFDVRRQTGVGERNNVRPQRSDLRKVRGGAGLALDFITLFIDGVIRPRQIDLLGADRRRG